MRSSLHHSSHRFASCMLAACMVITSLSQAITVKAQSLDPAAQALALLNQLTPEERVGQLFLVTFQGSDASENSQIYDLIVNHHVGGVVLTAENDNFIGPDNTPYQTASLIQTLQSADWQATQTNTPDQSVVATPTGGENHYIPLFVGISQEGDQGTYDQIMNGLTSLPNEMAIGATFNPDLAEQVGEIIGEELSTLGFNLFFGPSLDVLDVQYTETGEDLGVRTFGGDPYWVGMMGQSMISGIHAGSNNQILVISRHFPGRGSSDRPMEEEVATIRKSLEQLQQIDLAPFFAVTGNAPDAASTTDGLLVSHIRYQGLQGNIRATTRPVSFDATSLEQIISLPALAAWRDTGGLIISDDLGTLAVQRFFDPTGLAFDARLVARNAFLAGNDMLYMGNILSTGDPDTYTTIIHTLDSFAQKYSEDPAFAQRVDEAVLRLLTLKFTLYSTFNLNDILSNLGSLATLNQSSQTTFEVARQGATLVSPDELTLTDTLPNPPSSQDRIVFLTDERYYQQCSTCETQLRLSRDSLQNAILRLYGPQADALVQPQQLSSYGFDDLLMMMDDPTASLDLENDLQRADWVVVSISDLDPNVSTSSAFRRLLAERADLLRNKRVIVFAFSAPYYLDSTDISKITAYYGLFSAGSAFVDVAARLLFHELTPEGSLPVSVAGVGYDLITAMSPDPAQVITLFLDLPEDQAISVDASPQPTTAPAFNIGDTITIRTGVIIDHNGNPVPDGTIVRFIFSSTGEATSTQQTEIMTTQGVAWTTYRIESTGLLEIRAISDPAVLSEVMQIEMNDEGTSVITAFEPTPFPTITLQAGIDNEVTENVSSNNGSSGFNHPNALDWLLCLFLTVAIGTAAYILANRFISTRWGVRWCLTTGMGGMLAFLIANILRLSEIYETFTWKTGNIVLIQVGGLLAGWAFGIVWYFWPDLQARVKKLANNRQDKP
ncbi:MAG TPA: glycoside hydrolase family 3 N-terminal domain-containing protein [Longilinea sp.]|nr:glycoside hydrolase family 3 N-terminal domain-containing protein [Longilinea sp.]